MRINLDEGYQFGLGLFETIAVEEGIPVFLEEHLERLGRSMEFLGLRWRWAEGNTGKTVASAVWKEAARAQIADYLSAHPMAHGVLKIMVSDGNVLFTSRQNPYTEERYRKGFALDCSKVRRNETSPLTYHKTMNYGDCILEKRKAAAQGLDELLFLNMKGEICEGTSTNVFFIKGGRLYTPPVSCGMLPGVMRSYVCRQESVREVSICPADIASFDGCFVTNSLMGIMPVARLGKKEFRERDTADRLMREYRAQVLHRNSKKEK